jgi:hypothetical protein
VTIRIVQEERNEEGYLSVLAGRILLAFAADTRTGKDTRKAEIGRTDKARHSDQGTDCYFGIRRRQKDFQYALLLRLLGR